MGVDKGLYNWYVNIMYAKKKFTARELSTAFSIPVARWKRWAREFIGVDPIAGRHAGVPRSFDLQQTFDIYLGGVLVGDLLLGIPESVVILTHISSKLMEWGYAPGCEELRDQKIYDHVLEIQPDPLKGDNYERDIYGESTIRFREVLSDFSNTLGRDGIYTEYYRLIMICQIPEELGAEKIWDSRSVFHSVSMRTVRENFDSKMKAQGFVV